MSNPNEIRDGGGGSNAPIDGAVAALGSAVDAAAAFNNFTAYIDGVHLKMKEFFETSMETAATALNTQKVQSIQQVEKAERTALTSIQTEKFKALAAIEQASGVDWRKSIIDDPQIYKIAED